MRSRLRGVLLWQIFRTIRQRTQPDARINAVVEVRIAGRRDGGIDRHQLTLTDGRCRKARRGGRRPAVTFELAPVAFMRLVGGTASPQRLLIVGKLKVRGDLVLALALPRTLRLLVERERLAAAVTAIGQLTRSPDDRARELVIRSYTGVRRYLPLLLDTIEFHATDGGEAILEALTALNRSEGRRKLTPELLPTRFVQGRGSRWSSPSRAGSIAARTRCARWRSSATGCAAAMST